MPRNALSALAMLGVLALFGMRAPAPAPAPTPSPSPSLTPGGYQTAPAILPSVAPPPTIAPPTPNAEGWIPCAEHQRCVPYQIGVANTIACTLGYICTVILPGVHILPDGVSGVGAKSVAAPTTAETIPGLGAIPGGGGGDSSTKPTWSIHVENGNGVAYILVAPYPTSPTTNIVATTTTGIFVFRLTVDTTSKGSVYRVIEARHNRFYVHPHEPHDYATAPPAARHFVQTIACNPNGYHLVAQSQPRVWPIAFRVGVTSLHVFFSDAYDLPSVGVPLYGSRPPVNLGALGSVAVAYWAQGNMRTITILNCYPTVVFYTNDASGRHAVLLTNRPTP